MGSQNQVTQLVLTISGEQLIDSAVQKLCHNFYRVCFKLIWKSVREKMNIQWVKRGILSFFTLFFFQGYFTFSRNHWRQFILSSPKYSFLIICWLHEVHEDNI